MREKSPRLIRDVSHHCRGHRHRAALPPPGAGGQTDLRSPVHHIRLRHGLVRAAGAAEHLETRLQEAGIETAGFYELPL